VHLRRECGQTTGGGGGAEGGTRLRLRSRFTVTAVVAWHTARSMVHGYGYAAAELGPE
jgi:hypothetical protein